MQDGGSLDLIMNAGRIPVPMIAKITYAVSEQEPMCLFLLSSLAPFAITTFPTPARYLKDCAICGKYI